MSERIYVMEGASLEGEDAVGVRIDGDWTHVRIGDRTHSFERLVLQDGGNALRLEDGKIVDEGHHDALITRESGDYRSAWLLQQAEGEGEGEIG